MHKIALMASGTGTNALNLLERVKEFPNLKIEVLIVDKKNSPLLSMNLPIPIMFIPKKVSMTSSEHEAKIITILKQMDIEFIFLCGYMKLLSNEFISCFYDSHLDQSKIFNIHPSLLPAFKGANAYEDAFNSSVDFSGITIHLIDDKMDEGKILFQEKFEKCKSDSFDSFKNKGRLIEYQIYPKVFNWIEENYGK